MRRLGVFGGTFDPVHYGHLVCADQLREAFALDRVMFVPANRSPHKPGYRPAPAGHRLKMVELAVRGCRGFTVSDLEIKRGGTSYTVDTVRYLRRQFGSGPELWLLLGMDAYLEVTAWKNLEAVVGQCFMGVACRPGYKAARVPKVVSEKALFAEITPVDISSTDIRCRARQGRSIRFLVPPSVEAYVRRYGLYGSASRGDAGTVGRPRGGIAAVMSRPGSRQL